MQNVQLAINSNHLIVRAHDGMVMKPITSTMVKTQEFVYEVGVVCETPQGVNVVIPARELFQGVQNGTEFTFNYYLATAEDLNAQPKSNPVSEAELKEFLDKEMKESQPVNIKEGKVTKKPQKK